MHPFICIVFAEYNSSLKHKAVELAFYMLAFNLHDYTFSFDDCFVDFVAHVQR